VRTTVAGPSESSNETARPRNLGRAVEREPG
jgi:hypothetical protein